MAEFTVFGLVSMTVGMVGALTTLGSGARGAVIMSGDDEHEEINGERHAAVSTVRVNRMLVLIAGGGNCVCVGFSGDMVVFLCE